MIGCVAFVSLKLVSTAVPVMRGWFGSAEIDRRNGESIDFDVATPRRRRLLSPPPTLSARGRQGGWVPRSVCGRADFAQIRFHPTCAARADLRARVGRCAHTLVSPCVRRLGGIHHRATNFRDKYFTDGHYARAACSCDINYG